MKKKGIPKRKPHPGLSAAPLLIAPLILCIALVTGANAVKTTQSESTTVASHFKRKKPAAIKKRDTKTGDSIEQKVLSSAFSQIGTRYRYGGTTPETGFDCAGFVKWAYAQHGISLPRSSREQLNFGKAVPKGELRPGDIVIFSRRMGSARGTHAGIYVGNGKFIHSPRTGYTIRVDNAFEGHYAARFLGARRVITTPRTPPADDTFTSTLLAAGEAAQDKVGPISPDEDAPVAKRKGTAPGRSETLVASAEPKKQRASRHTISRGDTASRIAQTYGISTDELLAANNMHRNQRLAIGKHLIIPDSGTRRGLKTEVAEATPKAKVKVVAQADTAASNVTRSDVSSSLPSLTYTVQSGDTISAIAHRHGVRQQSILAANNLPARHTLQIGQKLTIPGAEAPALVQFSPAPEVTPGKESPAEPTFHLAGTTLYSVQSGDTVWAIARKFKVTEQAILDANRLGKRHILSLGQQLTIPAAKESTLIAEASTQPETQVSDGSPGSNPGSPSSESNSLASNPSSPISDSGSTSSDSNTLASNPGSPNPDSGSTPSESEQPSTGDQLPANWRLAAKPLDSPPLLVTDVFKPPAPASALAEISISPEQTDQPPASDSAEGSQTAETPAPESQVGAETSAATASLPAATEYIVVKGDTISGIAKKLGVTQKTLFEANALKPKHVLQLGQKLVVPQKEPASGQPPVPATAEPDTAAPAQTAPPEQPAPSSAGLASATQEYVVQSGDTIWAIARKFEVSTEALLEANKLPKKHVLRLGQKLVIPPRQ